MPTDSATSTHTVIGIECESLEHDTWGIARMTRKLLEHLAMRPALLDTHRFILYSRGALPPDPLYDHPLFIRRPVGVLPSFSLYYYVTLPLRLWWDRPHAMYYPNYMLPIIHPPLVPSLVMLTEDIWYEMRNPRQPLRYRVGHGVFATWASWWATRIMAISESSAQSVQKLFHIAPARMTTNALAVDAPKEVTPAPGTYLLYVGQAFERRHLRETIAAFEQLAASETDLTLIAIGPDRYDPPCIAALVSQTNARLGRPGVVHYDAVSDQQLASYFAGAQACIYVSDLEAFGLPPLEAISYGTPVVVADVPVNREIYREGASYVSLPVMPQGIAHAITRARGTRGDTAIAQRYSWSAHADRWLNTMRDMIGQ